MKKVEVVKKSKYKIDRFVPEEFVRPKKEDISIKQYTKKRVSKKDLKNLADAMSLDYDDGCIAFCKKLFNAYLKQMSRND